MNLNAPSEQYALIVEPDPIQRQDLIEIANELDLHCVEAVNGQEAIVRMKEQMPSVIIINLTVSDAERVIADETRQSMPALSTIPVVALAAYRDEAADWRGLHGLFPVGDALRHTKEDLRALIIGALSSPF